MTTKMTLPEFMKSLQEVEVRIDNAQSEYLTAKAALDAALNKITSLRSDITRLVGEERTDHWLPIPDSAFQHVQRPSRGLLGQPGQQQPPQQVPAPAIAG